MLALTVALALGQVLALPNPEGPIFSQPSLMSRSAYFEFAPASGAGMGGSACQLPNWVVGSDSFDTTDWVKDNSGVVAPTVTNAFAAGPFSVSADRAQVAACPAAGNYSIVRSFTLTTPTPYTWSIYLKANAGTPSVSVCAFGVTSGTRTCTVYALNTSTYVRAEIANATHVGGTQVEVGCENRATFTGASNTGVADVLISSAQINFGATASTFYPTAFASNGGFVPSGAKAESMMFTRTGNATCSKQGLATTGIANGDLVEMPSGVSRVESSGGVLGLRVEGARTNVLLRFIDISNATWADVGTPIIGGGRVSPFSGGLSASAVSIEDDAAGAFEGRTQTVTVTAATQYVMSCYVKALTTDQATISLDGTTNSITGLSATTWSIVRVVDASSSGVAIAAQVLVGDAVGDTGSVIWGGCQVEAGAYATSIQPTVAAAVARGAESAYLTMTSTQVGSFAATVQVPYPSSASIGTNRRILRTDVGGSDTDRYELYWPANATVIAGVVVGGVGGATPATALQTVPGTFRVAGWRTPGSTAAVIIGGTQTTAADALAAFPNMNRVYLGVYAPSAGYEVDGIVSQVQVDPSTTRAR